jgi:hypothetical protein
MTTRRSTKKADATPASVEPQDEQMEEQAVAPAAEETTDATPAAELISIQDLASYLDLPKGHNKAELEAVLDAATEVAEIYIGRKITKLSHEYKMAVQLLAARMYATGSLEVESFGAIPGTTRYFLELVKNGK